MKCLSTKRDFNVIKDNMPLNWDFFSSSSYLIFLYWVFKGLGSLFIYKNKYENRPASWQLETSCMAYAKNWPRCLALSTYHQILSRVYEDLWVPRPCLPLMLVIDFTNIDYGDKQILHAPPTSKQ